MIFPSHLSEKGGNIPEIKSHLVIDRPESVNLVKSSHNNH